MTLGLLPVLFFTRYDKSNPVKSNVNILEYGTYVKWLAFIFTVFFVFAFDELLFSLFQQSSQGCPNNNELWILPILFLLVFGCIYLFIESRTKIYLNGDTFIKDSLIFGKKEFKWSEVCSYKYNDISQYHEFYLPDGKKVRISTYMVGLENLFDDFLKYNSNAITKQLNVKCNDSELDYLLFALSFSKEIKHQKIFARLWKDAQKKTKQTIQFYFASNVGQIGAYDEEAIKVFPESFKAELDEALLKKQEDEQKAENVS